MNCWVVIYTHRYGVDAWPLFQDARPTEDSIIKDLDTWEPDRQEVIEVRGPFPLPASRSKQEGESYSKGWDSHEGSLLRILGIRDLECQGIDIIIKDLVKHCKGFKEWRARFKQGSLELKEAKHHTRRRR